MNDRDFNELREQITELGRRVDEQALLVRKAQSSVSSLADSVAEVVSRQRHSDRRQHLNSFIAYLLFTVLMGGGFFALYRTRTGHMVRERDDAVTERDAARHRVSRLRGELGARDSAAKKAFAFYKLIKSDPGEAIAEHPEIEREPLTPTERDLFADTVDKERSQIVDAGYLTGIDAYRKGDNDRAVSELRRGLAYQGEGARAAQMRYYLGAALAKKGEYEEAAHQLELALAGGVEDAGLTDARFKLARSLEQLGRYAEAKSEYDKFATSQPKSPWAAAARRKSAQLAHAAEPKN